MDTSDSVALFALSGGLVAGSLNFAYKGAPKLSRKDMIRYFLLFGAMGCITGVLVHAAVPELTPVQAGLGGGIIGSYVLLGLNQYF